MRSKPCACGGEYFLDSGCGAWVCYSCGDHMGLDRCYCGWSRHGTDGYRELVEMGEQIEEDF